jgi:hypothetical protein
MDRRKRWLLWGGACLLLLDLLGMGTGPGLRALYLHRVEGALLALAHDAATTQTRVAAIRKGIQAEELDKQDGSWTEQWFDGHIGLTKDGYVFYYDMHNPHDGTYDLLIGDVNVFYLPNEGRFCIYRKHFCCDLNKMSQPASKAKLLALLDMPEGSW